MLSYLVPMIVILLICFFTDLYTSYHFKYYQHSSETEYYPLKDICKSCHTHCHEESIVVQKVDVPLKSTAVSCNIFLVFFCFLLVSISNNQELMFHILIFVWLFFTSVSTPAIVFLSKGNNFANIKAARQRNINNEWNRTQNQQWVRKCAREERNSESPNEVV